MVAGMLMSHFHITCICLFILTVFNSAGPAFPESPVLWHSDLKVQDLAVLKDGPLVVATHEQVGLVNVDMPFKEINFPKLDRVFPGPEGLTLSAGVTWLKNGTVQVYSGDAETADDPLIFPMKPSGDPYRTRDGALWLVNPKGLIFRYHQGEVEQWDAAEFMDSGRVYGNNPFRFEIAESPAGQVVLYQQAGKMNYGSDIDGYMLWDRKDLQHVRLDGKGIATPGCAEFLDEERLLFGSIRGLNVVDVKSGETLETWTPPADFFPERVQPVFTQLLADGTRIVFYYRGEGLGGKSGPFAHGGFTQIVEIKDGEWKNISLKVDLKLWDYLKHYRPVLVENDGSVWTPSRGLGLAHRSPEGTWHSYDVSAGVPFEEIILLVRDGQRLWVADTKQGLACLDIPKLQTGPAEQSPWQKVRLATQPIWGPDDRLYVLSPEKGGQIIVQAPSGETQVISLTDTGYDSSHTRYMTVDSDGDPWLFGTGQQRYAVAYHKGGVWHTFPRDIRRENRFPPNCEHAFQSLLSKDPSYQVGKVDDPQNPVFSNDGRIVFINRRRKIRYFDGSAWYTPAFAVEAEKKRLSGPLFFHQDKLIAIRDDSSYQLNEQAWENREDEKKPAPWIQLNEDLRPLQPRALPRSGKNISPTSNNLPPNGPIATENIKWAYQDKEWSWVGNAEKVAASTGQGWISLEISRTPLSLVSGIQDVMITPDNRIYFRHRESGYVYSVYTAPQLEVLIEKTDLGTLQSRKDTLDPAPELNRNSAGLWQQYRIDAGPWSALLPVGPIRPPSIEQKGDHILSLVYYGKEDLARSRLVQRPFRSTYDLQQEIKNGLQMLGSLDFQKREEGSRLLEEIGEPALQELIRHMDSNDPEIRSRARELVLKITQTLKAEKE